MSPEDNKATIPRMAEAFNKRARSFIDHGFSLYFVLHTALTTTPDMRVTIEDLLAEGDRVAVRWTLHGTHPGHSPSKDVPTGEPFAVVAIALYRFADGKIEEGWGVDAQWQAGEVWK